MTLPIGSIVASVLTLQDFRALVPATETWDLADGSGFPVNVASALKLKIENGGAEYAALNPGNVPVKPNLNGAFPRGRDYEANAQKLRNPDGKTLVGTFQSDAVGSHAHGCERPAGVDADRGGQRDGWYGVAGNRTDASNGPETRPKNVTVNFFIRTN